MNHLSSIDLFLYFIDFFFFFFFLSFLPTGWSTKIPSYSPFDVIKEVKNRIKKRKTQQGILTPSYRGFFGGVTPQKDGYTLLGRIERGGERGGKDKIRRIRELPVGTWTTNYKKFLEDMALQKGSPIVDCVTHHTDRTVDFRVVLSKSGMLMSDEKLMDVLKLKRFVVVREMNVFYMYFTYQNICK